MEFLQNWQYIMILYTSDNDNENDVWQRSRETVPAYYNIALLLNEYIINDQCQNISLFYPIILHA